MSADLDDIRIGDSIDVGWSIPCNVTVSVGKVPYRRSIALRVTEYHEGGGATTFVCAYFRNIDEARRFLAALDKLMEAK